MDNNVLIDKLAQHWSVLLNQAFVQLIQKDEQIAALKAEILKLKISNEAKQIFDKEANTSQ